MQEDVTAGGGRVTVPKGLKLGANRRLAGEDVPAGAVVLPVGTVLEVQHIALAAALGLTELTVRRRLKVAIFSTGDEVVEPGSTRGAAAIFDSNRVLLMELLERLGASVTDLGILADDPEKLSTRLREAATGHDLIITTGGVSTGEADFVRKAVETIGTLVFWRVAIKPGRPVALGVIPSRAGQGAAFVGLPGNPVAVFVTFVRVVKPLLRRLSGARPDKLVPLPVRAAFAYKKKKDRREYVRVALKRAADGEIEAIKHPQDGAGILTSLTETDGLLEFPENVTTIEPGARVGFLSYAALMG
jgi:molybdopterin molybdotransferase